MIQERAPLFEALKRWFEQKPLSYHVPGHKNGAVFSEKGQPIFKDLLSIDVTELPGLDDLHDADGVIFEAEKLTADLYGTERSYFLVNGSTVGNLAMILATCNEGDTVLVQRNSHKSIFHALELANVQPVFLTPYVDETLETAVGVTYDRVKDALQRFSNVKALILTNPHYYGMTIALKDMIELAHHEGVTVLIDEAHGAHFGMHPSLPPSAISQGADVVVQSAHKMLPAMTMGAYLHVGTRRVDEANVSYYLQMLQSSSPSYPIMASLDLARHYRATFNQKAFKNVLDDVRHIRSALHNMDGLQVVGQTDAYDLDPFKVIIQSTSRHITGFQLQQALERLNVYAEMADSRNVLLVLPLARISSTSWLTLLAEEIETLSQQCVPVFDYDCDAASVSRLALSYQDMKRCSTERVKLAEAVGAIAAENITPYPPGIPMILKGERLTHHHIKRLSAQRAAGGHFQPSSFEHRQEISVFKGD